MKTANYCFFVVAICTLSVASLGAHATTVMYVLVNILLDDNTQMTGNFTWTYEEGDFENGFAQFNQLTVPHTAHNQSDLETSVDTGRSIEITFPGNLHDDGVDITLFLAQPLTPDAASSVDLIESKYEIGGNGFHTGVFLSGSIAPQVDTDGDGIIDSQDNCTLTANTGQRDTNTDGYGNLCDPDLNNDGIVNFVDVALWIPFFSTTTTGDADLNGDGAANFIDYTLFLDFFLEAPGPSGIAP